MDELARSQGEQPPDLATLGSSLAEQIIVARDLTPADTIMLRGRNMMADVTILVGNISLTTSRARSLGMQSIIRL